MLFPWKIFLLTFSFILLALFILNSVLIFSHHASGILQLFKFIFRVSSSSFSSPFEVSLSSLPESKRIVHRTSKSHLLLPWGLWWEYSGRNWKLQTVNTLRCTIPRVFHDRLSRKFQSPKVCAGNEPFYLSLVFRGSSRVPSIFSGLQFTNQIAVGGDNANTVYFSRATEIW